MSDVTKGRVYMTLQRDRYWVYTSDGVFHCSFETLTDAEQYVETLLCMNYIWDQFIGTAADNKDS